MRNSTTNHLITTLVESAVYQEYEKAFTKATGLPVRLHAIDSWDLPHRQRANENKFCALMARKNRSCALCMQVQAQLTETARHEPKTVTCAAGLSDTAIPVRAGDRLIGFLQTGQAFRTSPSEEQFHRVAKQAAEWRLDVPGDELRAAYFSTRVLTPEQYDSLVTMLRIFAQHLSLLSNQLLTRQNHDEPPVIARAKEFIREHHADELTLDKVARAVNTSRFYFCKLFKRATGLHFTDFVSRVRIEKAMALLLQPHLRVSEIAFDVGFQSLTHFNRVFRKIAGQSPTEYRDRVPQRLAT